MKKLFLLVLYVVAFTVFVISIIFHLNDFLLGFSGGILCAVVILTIYDVYKNSIYNKQFWILSLILLSPLAVPLYFLRREALIRMGTKFGTKGFHNSNLSDNG